MNLIDRIKRLTIVSLLSDEILMGLLVLKGGNAIDIAYDLSNRGSIDIDFSMEKDFTEAELQRVRNQINSLLNREFNKEGLHVFDVSIKDRPERVNDAVKAFWGGYSLQFKLIEVEKFHKHGGEIQAIRRNAIPLGGNNSTKFEVDISKNEYVEGKRPKDVDGILVYVYSPEMLALEKLRALAQQNPSYKEIVYSMTPKSRARDLYDIHNLITSFNLDLTTPENRDLCKHIFDAKHVPLDYLTNLEGQEELHRQSWPSVIDTINQKESLKDFDFYFKFVTSLAHELSAPAEELTKTL